ncbi:site-specific integrase [Streptococcus sp. S1]|uniref:Site-specific integrase n=1 Tax=Streptococcus dentalis TaxID=3098075 RepID=A0ABZ0T165_9STRE|nr:site-specific integrase [Streptococcus sp. S1]WPS54771.1 site-specific integrase [Streptococcus sp. S1]
MIKKYLTKDGETRYMLQVYLGVDPFTGKQKRTTRRGFKTQKEAKKAERELLLSVEENGFTDHSSKPTFEEVANLWLESYETTVKPTTYQNTRKYLNILIKDYFSDIRIESISVSMMQQIVLKLSKRYTAYSLYLSVVNRVFKFAMSLGIVQANPVDRIIRPKQQPPKSEKIALTKEELNQFLTLAKEHARPVLYAAWHTLAYTGLRKGELLGLEWSDIDLDNKVISVQHNLVMVNGKYRIQSPKTRKSIRKITIDDITASVLKSWKLEQKKLFFKNGVKNSNIVFSGSSGEYLDKSHFRVSLKKFLKRYDLPAITVHGLRHTHASLLFEAGVEPKTISDRLGHANIQTTLDMYTHLNDNQRSDVADRLLKFLEA